MRPLIAVGMVEGELLPPYHSDIPSSKIQSIANLVKERGGLEHKSSVDAAKKLNELYYDGHREVEIIGSWGQFCVPALIAEVLEQGMIAFVPDELIIYAKSPGPKILPYSLDLPSAVRHYNAAKHSYQGGSCVRFQYQEKDRIHIFTPE
ncbi:MAG: hypothetical protein KKF65_03210 [Nanoarchaeota archaeon]|nr:hypothetical protein [Nanoarchaeota archaeon]